MLGNRLECMAASTLPPAYSAGGEFTDDIFAKIQPVTAERMMYVLDEINAKWGVTPYGRAGCL